VCLEGFQRFLDQIPHVLPSLLTVVDTVAFVNVLVFEDVEDGQDLPVVRHEGLPDAVGGDHEVLEDLERGADTGLLPRVEGVLDGDDQLGDDGQDLVRAVLQHVVDTLAGEELVGVGYFAESVEEEGQVVVEVQLLDLHFPGDLVALGVVL